MPPQPSSSPKTVVVIGAGILGLSTAWNLQELGVEVTVIDRGPVGHGSSWGNAGWVVPGLVTPLAEPGAWRHGVDAAFRRDAPLHIPPRWDPALWHFLVRFCAAMTATRWQRTMEALHPLTVHAREAFDQLLDAGAVRPVIDATYSVGFRSSQGAEQFRQHLQQLQSLGQPLEHDPGSPPPQFSPAVTHALCVTGQGYVDPGAFVADLATAVTERGGRILEDCAVRDVTDLGQAVRILLPDDSREEADAVVLATGAWLPALARPWGFRTPLQAGRGYSFTVDCEAPLSGPLYLPTERIVATPYGDAIRIAGTMEFKGADEPMDAARIASIIATAKPLLNGIDWSSVRDQWVGSRPVTADGLPAIGRLRSPRVFATGGHGMWGLVLGPISGRVLAEQITTGATSLDLTPYDPLRR